MSQKDEQTQRELHASLLYQITSVLLLLFAARPTFGFRSSKPEWGVDSHITSMRELRFLVDGFGRTYWTFYVGFGLFVSVLRLFAGFVSWQLGGPPAAALLVTRGIAWALDLCFAVVTILSWRYFFVFPIIFCILIAACLIAAAWLCGEPS